MRWVERPASTERCRGTPHATRGRDASHTLGIVGLDAEHFSGVGTHLVEFEGRQDCHAHELLTQHRVLFDGSLDDGEELGRAPVRTKQPFDQDGARSSFSHNHEFNRAGRPLQGPSRRIERPDKLRSEFLSYNRGVH